MELEGNYLGNPVQGSLYYKQLQLTFKYLTRDV